MIASDQLRVSTAPDFQVDTELQADVVVVGSGAGGAVMAYELARRGLDVVVLEAGDYVPSSEFTEVFGEMLMRLYQDQGSQTNHDGDMLLLQGACVGGSTVVNATVAFRTPDYILQKWQTRFGLTDLTSERLAPYFDRVARHLSVHTNQAYEINRNSHVMREGADALGYSWQPLQRNIKQCALTGHCLSGCKTDRKQSMLVTYLPWAVQLGARLIANARVDQVLTTAGRAMGVEASIIDPATRQPKARLRVNAERVVLAAGAVQTPLLALASGVCNSSGQVGRNFACHPSTLLLGEFEQPVHAWRGALLGLYVDEFEHPDKGGFILEGGGAGPAEMTLATEVGTGKAYQDFAAKAKHLASMVTLIHDDNSGQVHWDGERKRIDYRLSDSDFARMKAAFLAGAEIYFAAGARHVYLPTVAPGKVSSMEEARARLDQLENQPARIRMVSYHPQGTMRMGADPQHSVVSPSGETHDVKHLYVADASLFPTSVLVNPQMSVYAMAHYIAEKMAAEKMTQPQSA